MRFGPIPALSTAHFGSPEYPRPTSNPNADVPTLTSCSCEKRDGDEALPLLEHARDTTADILGMEADDWYFERTYRGRHRAVSAALVLGKRSS